MKKILLVDDSKTNRMVLKAIINNYIKNNSLEEKIVTIEVENGQEALDVSEKEKIDLIFMDIMMPVMDGIEATKLIRQNNKKR
jgi:two-component system chemotaxis response regulator CheY